MGQGIQISEAKAPWVMFERRAMEDRAATIANGQYTARDVDFVLITPHGSKDQIEREVADWFSAKEQDVREGRFEASWLKAYKQGYEDWKDGKEVPLSGTPILNWSLLSPSQISLLQGLHVLTIEVLADANEELIKRLGMGGRGLVDKAKDFLKQSTTGKVVEEVGSLRTLAEGQAATIEALTAQIALLKQMVPQGNSSGEAQANQPPLGMGLSDLLDSPTPGRKL